MSLGESIAVLVVLLVAWEALFWALRRDLLGISLFRLSIAVRKRLPVGVYRWERENSISVGKPDSVVVFRIPLPSSVGQRPATHVAVTNSATRFAVGEKVVEVDPFLEAYDDEIGPLVVHVQEPGKIATIAIDTGHNRA